MDGGKKREKNDKLTWRDHIALFVALTETVMVPAVVLIIILLVIIAYFAITK